MNMPTSEELEQIAKQAIGLAFSNVSFEKRAEWVGKIEESAQSIAQGNRSEWESLILAKMLLLTVFRARQIRGG